MKKYLKVLLQDLDDAKKIRPFKRPVADDEIIPFEMDNFFEESIDDEQDSEAKKQSDNAPRRTGNIREIMGLQQEQFPSADYWSDDEAAQLVVALNNLLAHYHLAADYPTKLPPKMAYSTLVGALEKYAPIMPFGEWHLEFCNYEPSECPFEAEYCTCKDFKYTDYSKGNNGANLDFDSDSPNSNNIIGVYNYCDAWCERCIFVDRCAIGSRNSIGEIVDLKRFDLSIWKDDNERLINAKTWLTAQLQAIGATLIEPLDEERQIFDVEENEIRRDENSVALIQLADRYKSSACKWTDSDWIKPIVERVENLEMSAINDFDKGIYEACSVIQWYEFFIYVKLVRAIKGKIKDNDFNDSSDGSPKDSDGSAKIALIGAERSLVAWHQITVLKLNQKPFALKMMALLQAIIIEVESGFPEARNFMRAGFDDIRL